MVPAHEMTAIIKRMNDMTERPMTPEEESELAELRQATAQGTMVSNATQQQLRALRERCCDVERRRQIAAEMNANSLYAGHRILVRSGRLHVEQIG